MATKPIEDLTNGEKTTVRGHLKAVGSDTTGIAGSPVQILNTVALTQAEYDTIAVPDPQTNYVITDAPESQPLDQALTDYANAADAAARRALIGAEEAGIARLLIYDGSSNPPPSTGLEVGTLALIPSGVTSQLIYFTGEAPDGWRNVITGELGWVSPA